MLRFIDSADCQMANERLSWVELIRVGLVWVGSRSVGLGCVALRWVGLSSVVLGWVVFGSVGLGSGGLARLYGPWPRSIGHVMRSQERRRRAREPAFFR